MFQVYNKPYLNFDNHLDLDTLYSVRSKISAFVAFNSNLIRPTKYTVGNFQESHTKGIVDYQLEYSNSHDPLIQELLSKDAFGHYIVFEQPVRHGSMSMNLRYSTSGYQNKHLAKECQRVDVDHNFSFFYDWLDKQNIFEEYGRVNLFINHPGTFSEIHRDHPPLYEYVQDQFLWINLFDRKKFFLLDNDKKVYVESACAWFDTNNYHGTDPVTQSCYTIRVDGVFNKEFISKVV
jgi:hypothetical protein